VNSSGAELGDLWRGSGSRAAEHQARSMFAGMLLPDLGAEGNSASTADRPSPPGAPLPAATRGLLRDSTADRRQTIGCDHQATAGEPTSSWGLCERAGSVARSFRPGVAERLGVSDGEYGRERAACTTGREGWARRSVAAKSATTSTTRVAGVLWPPRPRRACPGATDFKPARDCRWGGSIVVWASSPRCRAGSFRRGPGRRRGDDRRQKRALMSILGARRMGEWGPRGKNLLDGARTSTTSREVRRRVRIARGTASSSKRTS